jgi:hypothetical protein
MRAKRLLRLWVVLGVFALIASSAQAGSKRIAGKVVAENTREPVAGLGIALIPPKGSQYPEKVTVTNSAGEFDFADVLPGRYLLEASQGLTTVYRAVIDSNNSPNQIVISLKPSTRSASADPAIYELMAKIDMEDRQVRLNATNALAFDKQYPTRAVVDAVLNSLGEDTIDGLSEQGRINCLTILSRRSNEPWTAEQKSRAGMVALAYGKRRLTKAESYTLKQFEAALRELAGRTAPN